MMRRVAGAARVAALVGLVSVLGTTGLPTPGAAQSVQAPPIGPAHSANPGAVPDVASGSAAIRGRIVHPERPEAVAGLAVVLYALPADGVPGLRGAETDARGEFAFEGIAGDPDSSYLVGVRYQDIPFGQRVTFAPGERERSVELEVIEPTTSAAGLEVGEVRIRVEPSCQDLQIGQALELRNPGEQVLYVPEGLRETNPPLIEVVLPKAASGFEVPFGSFPQGLERDGDRIRFWGPLYPGTQRLEFAYGLATAGGAADATHEFPSGAERLLVLSHLDAEAPSADGLAAEAPVEIEGRSYRVQSAGALVPGAQITLRLPGAATQASSDALTLAQARIWLELDDAALSVDERYEFEVAGDEPLRAAGAPLLCIPLPADADGLRFAPSTPTMGLMRDPSGALAVRGPLPPGKSAVSLRYLLPAKRGRVSFERSLGRHTTLLSLFVADTGLVVESDRLHRRRPFRNNDRSYMHLEGFEIEAGSPISLELSELQRPVAPSRGASSLIVGVLALGALVFLAAPLRSRPGDAPATDVVSDAVHERNALYATLRDLEHDFETGKVNREDYESTRQQLRARAVGLLRQERELGPAAEAPSAAAVTCPECGASRPDDARFCPQCGIALNSDAASVRSQGAA